MQSKIDNASGLCPIPDRSSHKLIIRVTLLEYFSVESSSQLGVAAEGLSSKNLLKITTTDPKIQSKVPPVIKNI